MLRLLLATLLGAAIGVNRELRQKPAGLRTHALVALGAALFTIVGLALTAFGGTRDPNAMSRLVQGIVTGVGFIGGGVILRRDDSKGIHGLQSGGVNLDRRRGGRRRRVRAVALGAQRGRPGARRPRPRRHRQSRAAPRPRPGNTLASGQPAAAPLPDGRSGLLLRARLAARHRPRRAAVERDRQVHVVATPP